MCMPVEFGRGVGTLELELWMIESYHGGAGNETWVPLQEQQVFLID